MPFYIRSIHPADAWYSCRDRIVGKRLSNSAIVEEEFFPGFNGVTNVGITPDCRDGCYTDEFLAVELQWEDY